MIQPWGHYVCSYLLPTIGVAWMFDDSLIFGFVSSVLRYHVTAHRVQERACSKEGAQSMQCSTVPDVQVVQAISGISHVRFD